MASSGKMLNALEEKLQRATLLCKKAAKDFQYAVEEEEEEEEIIEKLKAHLVRTEEKLIDLVRQYKAAGGDLDILEEELGVSSSCDEGSGSDSDGSKHSKTSRVSERSDDSDCE